ncbi:hypothetical protein [Antrihabitans stalactiti]|nr:hypothetical protein [Antrihabitans stalactiti]
MNGRTSLQACKNFADFPEASGIALVVVPACGVSVVDTAVVETASGADVEDAGANVEDAVAGVETDWLGGIGSASFASPLLPHAAELNADAAKTKIITRFPIHSPRSSAL